MVIIRKSNRPESVIIYCSFCKRTDPTETLIDELADFFETMFSEDVATYMTDSLVSWVYAIQDCGYKIQLSYVVDLEQLSEVVEQNRQELD